MWGHAAQRISLELKGVQRHVKFGTGKALLLYLARSMTYLRNRTELKTLNCNAFD